MGQLALTAPPSPAESEDASGLITPEKKPKAAPAPRGSPKKSNSTAILPYKDTGKETALAIPEGGVRVSEKAKKEARVTTRADGSRIKMKTVNKEQKTHARADGKHVETRTQSKERKLTSKADGTVTHSKSTTIKRISYKEA